MPEISKTLDLGLRILLELSDRGPMGVRELSTALELNRTVVHRLLATFQGRGFVMRQGSSYALGPALLRVSSNVEPELRAAADSVMREVVDQSGETAVLHVHADLDAVVLHQVVGSQHVVRVEHKLGSRHHLIQGASGRAILAFADNATIKRALATSDHPERLSRQLESVQQLGYSVSQDELQLGVSGVAAPIFGADSHAIGSFAILVPRNRAASITDYADVVIDAAARVSAHAAAAGHRSLVSETG